MPKRIIAVFHNAELLRATTDVLAKVGYEVCPAFNLAELKEHLLQGGCDIVVIGPTIPAVEKLRIANFVAQSHPECMLLEIFDSSPDLPKANVHLHKDAGNAMLVEAVAHL